MSAHNDAIHAETARLQARLIELQRDFPDIAWAYWFRDEFDARNRPDADSDETMPLTDGEWQTLRDDFPDMVYDTVANAEQMYYAVESATGREFA